ncbi:MAG: hypothetical protein H8E26_13080 [FCB group bacterium]|jgi:hypothetical protein|nr:hypothetical protein [FCB group bacterium]
MSVEALNGLVDGIAGNSVSLFVNGIKIMALKNFNWKIKQEKTPLTGAGNKQAHGVTRSFHKEYEIDFEVKEIASGVLIDAAETVKNILTGTKQFKLGDLVANDLLDVHNATIVLFYPGTLAWKSKVFTGCEFTDQEGGISDDGEPIGMKVSGFALDAKGLF